MNVDGSWLTDVFASGAERPFAVVAFLVRWLGYAGVLIASGAAAFLMAVADRRDRAPLTRITQRAAVAGIVAALLIIPLHAAQASGEGIVAMVRPDLLVAAASGSQGVQSLLQVVALGALLLTLRSNAHARPAPLVLIAGSVAVGALVVAGHSRTTQPAWLVMAADAVHVGAAAIWIGGLLLLWPAIRLRRSDDDPVGAAALVARFSRLATYAVLGVIVAGLTLAYLLVGTPSALFSTRYGWVLVAKGVLAATVIAIGTYNNRRLVPMVAQAAGGAGTSSASDSVAPTALHAGLWRGWQRLTVTVRWEVIGLTAVLGVTAVLVEMPPATMGSASSQGFGATVAASDGHQLIVMVEPNRVGTNRIHLYLVDSAGQPADAGDLHVRLTPPAGADAQPGAASAGLQPIEHILPPIFPGHWLHAGGEFSVAGTWQIDVSTVDAEGADLHASVAVAVAP